MKHINKQKEPQQFIDWKNMANEDWQPSFNSLRGSPTGYIVKCSLIKEQGGLCCYCESKITEDDSHFEHFRPQTQFKNLVLDYGNLHCSCIKEPKKETDIHCGHFKWEHFDEKLISPLEPDCESHFIFGSNGKIEPSFHDDKRAIYTIDILGLNNNDLPEQRKAMIDVFNGAGRELLSEDDILAITVDDQIRFAKGYLQHKENGMFNEFWTTINYFLQQL
jgi:uncharacterized protein (TIGR02646 family)